MQQRVLLAGFVALACSAGAPEQPEADAAGGNAGAAGVAGQSAGATTLGGANGSAGASMAGTGGVATAGMSGGGTTATAGGDAGGVAGTGGAAAGGTSGGGSGGASSNAKPSAGCGKSGRPQGGVVTVQGDHIYNFPEKYDGNTPLPMLLGLHANNNPYTQIQGLTNNSKLATDYVRVFPKSAGQGWVYDTDKSRITKVFDDVLANYCVDTSRVFLTGHSSGAQMAVQMLCGGDDRFKAVAPVAASKYCSKIDPIPVMYIQGMKDAQRGNGNGADVVSFFTSSNSCQNTTMPDSAVGTCKSTFDQQTVTPGCVTYQGCSMPTIWCSHNDNGYNNTDGHMHGWPCFASSAMADFFAGLP